MGQPSPSPQSSHGIPSGVVGFIFTDIEGSTRKWEADKPAMSHALKQHDDILRSSIEAHHGYVFKTVGDAFCAAFSSPLEAVEASIEIQVRLASASWLIPGGIRVRIAIHAGQSEERDGDYFGPTLNRVARVQSLVYGAQVVLTLAACELVLDHLPADVSLKPMGKHRLKDLERPEEMFQLRAPGLQEDFPPPKGLDTMPNNLPLQPNPLLGRQKELSAVSDAFAGGARLVTFTGMGGAGKTRLALQTAAELLDRYEGGAWFVDLSDCTDLHSTLNVVATALSVHESPGRDTAQSLSERLSGRHLLLVLDNLEQDRDAPSFVAGLLGSHPGLTILATSRGPLRLRWERAIPLPPLGLPESSAGISADKLSHYEAVRLFIDRAKSARPSFSLDDANAPAVAELCLRLEGVHLAIELAAARISAFSPDEILKRLAKDYSILSGGDDLPDRHRNIKAVVAWSYDLLPAKEAKAFRALSEFRSGFDLGLAEDLLDVIDHSLGAAAMDMVARLVEKSLIVAEEGEGPTRYRMLGMLREYGRSIKTDALPARIHAELFKRRAAEAFQTDRQGSPAWNEVAVQSMLSASYPDFIAAFDYLLAHGRIGDATALATGLWRFWHIHGLWTEGIERLESVLSKGNIGSDIVPPLIRAGALRGLGALLRDRGEMDKAMKTLGEAELLYRNAKDQPGESSAVSAAGWCALYRSGAADALAFFERAVALAGGQDRLETAAAIQGLATVRLMQDHLDESRSLHLDCMARFEHLGELTMLARATENLAVLEMRARNHDLAKELYGRASELYRSLGDREGQATAKLNMAWLEYREESHAQALESFKSVVPSLQTLGATSLLAHAYAGMAACMVGLGRFDGAVDHANHGLAMIPGNLAPTERGLCLRSLGEAKAALGAYDLGMTLIAEAQSIFDGQGDEEESLFTRKIADRVQSRSTNQS